MRARRAGRIITIGSTGGRFTSPGAGAYHTVKYAVEALSLSLGAEVAPFGVRVVLIDPTGVRTPFVTSQFETVHSYPDDDPYGEFKIRYAETTRRLAKTTGYDWSAPTRWPARWCGPSKPRIPNPATSSGRPGKASVLARALLSDRMWDRDHERAASAPSARRCDKPASATMIRPCDTDQDIRAAGLTDRRLPKCRGCVA